MRHEFGKISFGESSEGLTMQRVVMHDPCPRTVSPCEWVARIREAVELPDGWHWVGGGPGTPELILVCIVLSPQGEVIANPTNVQLAIEAAREAGLVELETFLSATAK